MQLEESLQIESAEDADEWNDFLAENGGPYFFHCNWIELSESSQRGKPFKVLVKNGNGVIVGLAWGLERWRLGLKIGVQPILTPYAGIWVPNSIENQGRMIDAIWRTLKTRFYLIDLQMPAHINLGHSTPQTKRRNYTIDLKVRAAEWEKDEFAGLTNSTKRQVKKAQNNKDLEVCDKISDSEVFQITNKTFEKRGSQNPIPYALIVGLLEECGWSPRGECFGVRSGDKLISLLCLLYDPRPKGKQGGRAYYAHAATDPDYLSTGVASLLIHEGLRRAASHGCEIFDFCGANIPSIAKFKKGFGVEEELLPHLLWSKWPGLITLRNKFRRS